MYRGWRIGCVWRRGTRWKQNKEIEKKYGDRRAENGLEGGEGRKEGEMPLSDLSSLKLRLPACSVENGV